MFQFISQCKLCDFHDEARVLGRVPLGNVTYQISTLWTFYFLARIFSMFSLNNLLIEEKSGKL